MSTNVPKGVIVEDGYGRKHISQKAADYFWGDKAAASNYKWTPKAKIPQLETLIELFDETDIAIAGGAVLASLDAVEYNDIDVFPMTEKAVKIAKEILSNIGYKETKTEDHYLLYERTESSFRPVQIILLHTDAKGDVQVVLNRFDISVCQVAIWHKRLHSNTIAIEDIQRRTLRANKTMNIDSLIRRVIKYNKRGYNVVDGMTREEHEKAQKQRSNTTAG